MAIAEKYDKRALDECAKLFAYISVLLDKKHEDVLGTMYMMLDFGDKNKAQEFTPFGITQLVSRIAILDKDESKNIDINIFVKGYVSVNDCSCGAGSMIIGYAMMLKSFGYNYQKHLTKNIITYFSDYRNRELAEELSKSIQRALKNNGFSISQI